MTQEDLAQIRELITEGNKKNICRAECDAFRIDAKEHYDQHQRIDRLLRLCEQTSSNVLKIIFTAIILGLLGSAGAWLYLSGKRP